MSLEDIAYVKVRCEHCSFKYEKFALLAPLEKLMGYPTCPSTYCRIFRNG